MRALRKKIKRAATIFLAIAFVFTTVSMDHFTTMAAELDPAAQANIEETVVTEPAAPEQAAQEIAAEGPEQEVPAQDPEQAPVSQEPIAQEQAPETPATEEGAPAVEDNASGTEEDAPVVEEGAMVAEEAPIAEEGAAEVEELLEEELLTEELPEELLELPLEAEIQEFTVTFQGIDGSVLAQQLVAEGEGATAPEAPAVEGFLFTGWDTDFSAVTADLTVNALYEALPPVIRTFMVTFAGRMDEVLKVVEVKEGEGVNEGEIPQAPEVEGFIFTGWDGNYLEVHADTTIHALYEVEQVEFNDSVTLGSGVTISAHADKGIIPKGSKLQVMEVSLNQSQADIAESAAGEEDAIMYAYDISILAADGSTIQPEDGQVQITFGNTNVLPGVAQSDGIDVVHVADDASGANVMGSSGNTDSVSFATEHFSMFVIIANPLDTVTNLQTKAYIWNGYKFVYLNEGDQEKNLVFANKYTKITPAQIELPNVFSNEGGVRKEFSYQLEAYYDFGGHHYAKIEYFYLYQGSHGFKLMAHLYGTPPGTGIECNQGQNLIWVYGRLNNMDIDSAGYEGTYDAMPHGITLLNLPTGATVYYGSVPLDKNNYLTSGSTIPIEYTNVGTYTVYYYIIAQGFSSEAGSETVKINQALLTVSANNLTIDYNDPIPTYTFAISGFAVGEDEDNIDGEEDLELTGTYIVGSIAGTYPITITEASFEIFETANEGGNYKFEKADGLLTVQRVLYTVTWMNHTITLETDTDVIGGEDEADFNGEEPTYEEEGKIFTFVGWSTDSDADPTDSEAVKDEDALGVITQSTTFYAIFSSINIMDLLAEGFTGVYDGDEHGINIEGLPEGAVIYYGIVPLDENNYLQEGSTNPLLYVNAGEYPVYYYIVAEGYQPESGMEVVEITERPITITAGSASKTYDGTPLTNGAYSITSGSLVDGHELLAVVTGTITAEGSVANVLSDVTITEEGEEPIDVIENYAVTLVNGTLTITAAPGGGGETPAPTPTPVTVTILPTPNPLIATLPPTFVPLDDEPVALAAPPAAAPAAPEEAPAEEPGPTVIEEEPTPLAPAEPEEELAEIEEEDVPLAVPTQDDCWIHWLILLLTAIYTVYQLARGYNRKKKIDELQQDAQEQGHAHVNA